MRIVRIAVVKELRQVAAAPELENNVSSEELPHIVSAILFRVPCLVPSAAPFWAVDAFLSSRKSSGTRRALLFSRRLKPMHSEGRQQPSPAIGRTQPFS